MDNTGEPMENEASVIAEETLAASNAAELYVSWPKSGMLSSRQYTISLREGAGDNRFRETQFSGMWQEMGGNGPTHRAGLLGLQLTHGLTFAPTNTEVTGLLIRTQYVPEKYRLTLMTSAGAARLPNSFVLNGTDGNWQARGAPQTKAAGQFVASATMEAEFVLQHIKHGMLNQPIFLDNLSAAVFTDAVAVANRYADSTSLLTAGVELRLTTLFGYGASQNDLRIGAARRLDGATPWHLYFKIGSGF
jgi:hypothetical protein